MVHRTALSWPAGTALVLLAAVASCTGRIGGPLRNPAVAGDAGTDGGVGGGEDAGVVIPFTADPPAVYVAKVKNILVGLPPDASEIAAVEADPTQLGNLVDAWMQLPEYYTKMQRFFELAFQQTQVGEADFDDQIFGSEAVYESPPLLQNLQESFARTMVYFAQNGTPFNQAMSTQSFMMTTALKAFYGFMDDYQAPNLVGCGIGSPTSTFAQQNPTLAQITVTASPIPISETVDPTSPNFMQWYSPDFAQTGCPTDPMVVPLDSRHVWELLFGNLPGATIYGPSGMCSHYLNVYTGPFQPTDYQDWRMTTITQPPAGSQATTPFWNLPLLRTTNALVLTTPRVGFFTTPAFFANWQTNASNQMRVTMNQTLIVATGQQVDPSDPTVPPATPGLDAQHAAPGTACYQCHQFLDPSRSILAATYSWNYGLQPDPNLQQDAGLFAFEGVVSGQGGVPAVKTIYDLGTVLAQHPLLASGWAQKLCYYVNSQSCVASDPAFQQIVNTFAQHGDYNWNQLVKALVTSPITTHAASTLTAATNGEVVTVARRDHLCAALNARLGFQDVCGLNVTVPQTLPYQALSVVSSLPSDAYARGSLAPVLPTAPTMFLRGGMENFCEALATLVVDNPSPPAGATTWSSSNSAAAISDFVTLVMGVPQNAPRYQQLEAILANDFDAGSQFDGGTLAPSALQSTFTAACMAPPAISIGL